MRRTVSRFPRLLTTLLPALLLAFCSAPLVHAQVQPTRVFHEPDSATISGVALSPDGTRLVMGSTVARVWDVNTGELIATLHEEGPAVSAIAFSRDAKKVITGDWDVYAMIWDVETGQVLHELRFGPWPFGHLSPGPVVAVALSRDGRYLAAGASSPDEIKVWDTQTGEEMLTLAGPPPIETKYLAFFPDGRRFLVRRSLNDNGWAEVWDVPTRAVVSTFDGFVGKLSADGKRVFTSRGRSGVPRTYTLWDAQTAEVIASIPDVHITTRSCALSPDGGMLLTRLRDGTTRLVDTETRAVMRDLSLSGKVLSPHQAFSADGKLMLTAGRDTVYVWDVSDLTSAVGDAALYNR